MKSYNSLSNSLTAMHEVVGTVEGGRAPTKIKTDLKKPVVNLACHPRLPVLVHFHFPGIRLFLSVLLLFVTFDRVVNVNLFCLRCSLFSKIGFG